MVKNVAYFACAVSMFLPAQIIFGGEQGETECKQETVVKTGGEEPIFGVRRDPPKGSNYSVWLGIYPQALVADSRRNIYVADQLNYRILKFDKNGKFRRRWSLQGSRTKATRGASPWIPALAVDLQDNLYVVNEGYRRVEIYQADGTFVRSIEYGKDKLFKLTDDTFGHGYTPEFIRVDFQGNVYLFDRFQGGGGVYSANGRLVTRDVEIDSLTGRGVKHYDETKAVGYNGYQYTFRNSHIDVFNHVGQKVASCPLGTVTPVPTSSGNDYVYTADSVGNIYLLDQRTMDIVKISIAE